MRFTVLIRIRVLASLLLICHGLPMLGQQSAATAGNLIVPPMVQFSGLLTDLNGKPLSGVVGFTFCLYKDSQGEAPLWMETQNVQPNKAGHYSVMLGSTSSQGVPLDLFVSGEATAKAQNETFRWQAEPAGSNTSSPSGTLNLLFGSGPSKPAETGLKISNTGMFTFASGQTFPGTGRWLPDGQGEQHAIPRGVIFAKGGTQEQTCIEGAKTKSDLESLAGEDIHRLVRVTAHKRLVQKTAS